MHPALDGSKILVLAAVVRGECCAQLWDMSYELCVRLEESIGTYESEQPQYFVVFYGVTESGYVCTRLVLII